MNQKITPGVLEAIVGKRSDELVSLRLRITTPLTEEQISKLTAWGGTLLFDSGMLAVVILPVGKLKELAAWKSVIEIL